MSAREKLHPKSSLVVVHHICIRGLLQRGKVDATFVVRAENGAKDEPVAEAVLEVDDVIHTRIARRILLCPAQKSLCNASAKSNKQP
jgi:hypothetical protein